MDTEKIWERVKTLIDPLLAEARTHVTEFYFSADDEWHPGSINIEEGYILIGRKYAEAASDEDIQATFGHELGHALSPRHNTAINNAEDHARSFLVTGLSCALLTVAAFAVNAREVSNFLAARALEFSGISLAATLIGKHQQRQSEFEADRIAAALVSPKAVLTDLKNLQQKYGEPKWTPLSTHPPLAERIDALKSLEITPEGQALLQTMRNELLR